MKKKTPLIRLWMVPAAMLVLLAVLVVLPLAVMFANMDGESIRKVFANDTIGQVLLNSVTASTLTTVISLVLAYGLAWCVVRTCMPCKKLLRTLAMIPMLIPSVSIGMGVVQLRGNNGILTNLFGLQDSNIYGLPGIVWGSVMYALPVAFVMIENILKYEDFAPYEAAEMLGIPKWRQFTGITLPYLRKPMIAAAFSTFTLSFTDYGVPLMVGGKFRTLPMVMYQEVIGQLNFGKGCVYGAMLLVPAVVAFVLDLLSKNSASTGTVARPFVPRPKRRRDGMAFLFSGAVAAFNLMPVAAFMVLAFVKRYPSDLTLTLDNFTRTMNMGAGIYLINSVVIAALVAVVGTGICILTAYFTARTQVRTGKTLHLIAMSTGAIPGVVLGLAYVLAFRGSPLYGTLIILVMVNIVHFFSSPYLMIHAAFGKLSLNLETAAVTLRIPRVRLLFGVLLPGCAKTIGEMVSYFFVNSMMTVSAVSFLANAMNKPVALMINQFEAQAQMEAAAVVSLLILAVNLTMKALTDKSLF